MSLTNAPDPEVRKAVVKQDLDNVMHPIVQHTSLEKAQMVVVGAQGSTVRDHDGAQWLYPKTYGPEELPMLEEALRKCLARERRVR